MFGLSDSDFKFIRSTLERFAMPGVQVFVFGSRSRGDHHTFSDLDLMIETQGGSVIDIGQVQEEFEESRLPIKIDIVRYQDFAEHYRASYDKDKIRIL